ncbi:MAG: sporulation initiation factor Spo0A C-terminal domain-containing protein [Ruminococcus sp.]|nr:sporulation initiation factor Spo0A C-terminal domain-containing protein [Ruminococcus sp.]
MNNNILLIFGENRDYCMILKRFFREYGMNTEILPDNEKLIMEKLSVKRYNAVIVTAFCDTAEKIGIVTRIGNICPETAVAVLNYTSLYMNCRKFISAGAERCLIMPQSPVNVCNCVMHMLNDQYLYLQETADFMANSGFPQHLNSFYYFCAATELCMVNRSESISAVYNEVAERFGTNADIIESSIRHFVKVSHKKGIIKKFFNDKDKRPSNNKLIRFTAESMKDFYEIFKDGRVIEKNEREWQMLVCSFGNEIFKMAD